MRLKAINGGAGDDLETPLAALSFLAACSMLAS